MKHQHICQGTCSRSIDFEIDAEGRLRNVCFNGGCHGNTQGISALVEGAYAAEVANRLRGIRCGNKATSCPDQLARAIDSI